MESFDLRLWKDFSLAGGNPSSPAIVDQISIDSRRIDSPNSLFVALKGNLDGHDFVLHAAAAGCRFALVRRDWKAPVLPFSIHLLRVEDPLKAFQEIAQSYRRHLNVPTIAIIGSYGKTMVKDLLHKMLCKKYHTTASPESFNSQIGVPLSLLTIKHGDEVALIEAAFSKKGELEVLAPIIEPDHVILTHIGKKHLATMGSLVAIAGECCKCLSILPKSAWMLLPDDPLVREYEHELHGHVHHWNNPSTSLPHAQFLKTEKCRTMTYRADFPDGVSHIGQITSGFYYFLDLINITMKAAWLMGVSSETICETLDLYTPEPMRTEIWKSPAGITFINDTYCSDPQSVDVALKHFDLAPAHSRKIFVFHGIKGGGENKAASLRRIGKALHRTSLDKLFLVGNHPYEELTDQITDRLDKTNILRFSTLSEAYHTLQSDLRRDDVVLLKGEAKQHLDTITETFNDSLTNNQFLINLAAISSNIKAIKQKLPPNTRLLVIVKALAYGTDDVRMAHFLAGCGIDILGISHVDEGAALRRAGVNTALFVINAGVYEAAKVVKYGLETGVSEKGLIEALEAEALKAGKYVRVHLHVNTGMSRLGCRPEEALELAKKISTCKHLILEGIMTHFAASEDPDEDEFTEKQAEIFSGVIENLRNHGIDPKWKHASNSSGVLRFDFPQYNMARVGLAVYGLHASKATQHSTDLRLAFSLLSRVVGINICKGGETVSYGRTYRVSKEEQRIAVLPIGYFDGLHRNYSGKGYVIIQGRKAPMVGRITMDYMMVDITNIPHAAIGDPVLLFGEDEYGHFVSPEDFAFNVESIPHELITCLGPRIQRVFVYEEGDEKKYIIGEFHGCIPETA